jgi:hypothetical protein
MWSGSWISIAGLDFHCISVTGFENRRNGKISSDLNLIALGFAVHVRQLIRHFCAACSMVSASGETFCS